MTQNGTPSNAHRLPLSGVRIIEPGSWVAVPMAVKLLADMGADVIKVESLRHPTIRAADQPDFRSGLRPWDRGSFWHEFNRNKRSLAIDLATPEGKAAYLSLVKVSDVVAENFAPGVMDRLGLGYQALKAANPQIIMLSSSGYGHSGPWREYVAVGSTLESTTGLSSITGYPGGPPVRSTMAYSDTPAAMMGATCILAALLHREETGEGQWIDLSQYEVGVAVLGPVVLDYFFNGRIQERLGNRDTSMAPHGLYRCTGSDNWIAIAVGADAEFAALCGVIGQPELAMDPRFADVLSRHAHQDELDPIVEAWTRPQDHLELFHRLQAAGITAAPVLNNKELLLDPHLRQRGYWHLLDYPGRDEGVGTRPARGVAWHMSRTPGALRLSPPTLGQDNRAILGELLGCNAAEIAALEEAKVIGDTLLAPVPANIVPREELEASGRIEQFDPDYRSILGIP